MDLTVEEITRIAQQVPGEVVVYKLDSGLQRLYASEGIPALTGYSPEEFASLPDDSAMDLVAESDRERVFTEIDRGLRCNNDFDITYRVLNRANGFVWVHGRGRTIGTLDGKPVFIASLVNASLETAPQAALIGSSTRPIYVIDKKTYEVLFMNAACESIYGGTLLPGQKCFEYKYGFDEHCPWCPVPTMAEKTTRLDDRYVEKVGRWLQFDYLRIDWFGHDAVAVYAFDVAERHAEQEILRETLDWEERLLGYIKTINGQGSLTERIDEVLCNVGGHLRADRANIFDIDGNKMSNTHEWCADGVAPEIENLQNIDVGLMGRWLAYLAHGQCVIVKDIDDLKDSDPTEYELMSKQGIRSYVEAPLLAGDKLVGYIGVDNPDANAIERSADLLLSLAYYI